MHDMGVIIIGFLGLGDLWERMDKPFIEVFVADI